MHRINIYLNENLKQYIKVWNSLYEGNKLPIKKVLWLELIE
jgi:hypothetical protein